MVALHSSGGSAGHCLDVVARCANEKMIRVNGQSAINAMYTVSGLHPCCGAMESAAAYGARISVGINFDRDAMAPFDGSGGTVSRENAYTAGLSGTSLTIETRLMANPY